MHAKLVTERNGLRNDSCLQCHRRALVGQLMLVHTFNDGPLTRSRIVIHDFCVRALLAGAPEPQDDTTRAFLELRDRIHATGEAFPE